MDTIIGDSNSDTINAFPFDKPSESITVDDNTFTVGDYIDGGAGVDTLNIYLEDGFNPQFPSFASVKNVEIVNLRSVDGNTFTAGALVNTVDASMLEGVQQLWQYGNANDVTKVAAGTAVGFGDDNGLAQTITAKAGVSSAYIALSAATGTLTTSGATSVTVIGSKANGTFTLNINETSTATQVNLNTAVATSLIVGEAAVKSINAAESSGAITVTLANDQSLTSGSGNDFVSLGATSNAVNTGAGDDTISLSASALAAGGAINGGTGADTLTMSSANASTASTATTALAISNIEKLSLGQTIGTSDIADLSKLGNANYVVSAGTGGAVPASKESFTIDLTGTASGTDSVTFDGATFSFTPGGNANSAFTVGDSTTNWSVIGVTATSVNFEAIVAGAKADVTSSDFLWNDATSSGSQSISVSTPSTQGASATSGSFETFTLDNLQSASGNKTFHFDGSAINLPNNASVAQAILAITTAAFSNWIAAPDPANPTTGILFTAKTVGDKTNVTGPSFNGANQYNGFTIGAINDGSNATAAIAEVFAATLAGTASGPDSVTFDGVTVQLAAGDSSTVAAVKIATAVNASAGAAWTATSSLGVVTFTAKVAGATTDVVVGDFVFADGLTTGTPGITVSSLTQGYDAGVGTLTVSKLRSGGTFELTGIVAGSNIINVIDSAATTSASDVLNLKLYGSSNLVNTGTVTVADVETINITTSNSATTSPTVASTVNLIAAAATTVTVTGNHGVDFSGSTLSKVNLLDASGVTGSGAGGRVNYVSANADATKSVTIKAGTGDDFVVGGAGNDAISLGAGKDETWSTSGADTFTLGAGSDKYVLKNAAHSVLGKMDVITDFNANTYGQGASGASTSAGATLDPTKLTGDVIDLSDLISATGVSVFVAGNAADATVFVANTGENTSLAGIGLDASTGKLYVDLDSNGTIDSVIQLTGVTAITEAAFVI